MEKNPQQTSTPDIENPSVEQLRQSFLNVLQPHFFELQTEISVLEKQLEQLRSLTGDLPEDLRATLGILQELSKKLSGLERETRDLGTSLNDPQAEAARLKPVLGMAIAQGVEETPDVFVSAIAPVISPAIRNQIRNARGELVSALYPIIGQTITKAIAEAIRELRRSIDTRMKQDLNPGQQARRLLARLRGVSHSELVLRDAFPYEVTNIFLIHRHTGLPLEYLSGAKQIEDHDLVTSMLTAIRDFAHDAFGKGEDELEEIQYGDSRILLSNGKFVYLAVVVQGNEPSGYGNLMKTVISELNIEHEHALRGFNGDMKTLPDFDPSLKILFAPTPESLASSKLSRAQKTTIVGGLAGVVLALVVAIFACNFSIHLWPLAYPAPTATATATFTQTATQTSTPTFTATFTPTYTLTPSPTPTMTPTPTATTESFKAIITGNVWMHLEPDLNSKINGLPVSQNTHVIVEAVYGNWVRISWQSPFGLQEGWVVRKWVGNTIPFPELLITPTP